MTELDKNVFNIYAGWFLKKIKEGKINSDMSNVELFNFYSQDESLMIQKIVFLHVKKDYKSSYEVLQGRMEFWKSLVLEATKKEWCKTPDLAIDYANSIIDNFNGFLNEN